MNRNIKARIEKKVYLTGAIVFYTDTLLTVETQ